MQCTPYQFRGLNNLMKVQFLHSTSKHNFKPSYSIVSSKRILARVFGSLGFSIGLL